MPESDNGESYRPAPGADGVYREYPPVSLTGPGGKTIEGLLLYENEDGVRRVRLLSTLTFMKVFLDYDRLLPSHTVTAGELGRVLDAAGVLEGIDDSALEMLADLLNVEPQPPGLFQVAKGNPPRDGDDGYVDFSVHPTRHKAEYVMDESGSVDYKQLNLIDNAHKGQTIAVLKPPTRGTPGNDVFGRAIPAKDGKPMSVHVGKNVSVSAAGTEFVSELDGRVIFERNSISVSELYEVQGTVDYKVGNIDFVGYVVVRGNVLDDFDVTGGKGVTIFGNVGKCEISSGGNVEIAGGISGRGEGKIVAGGSLKIKYLNDTRVECEGDVAVEKEIVNSAVRAMGAVSIPGGAIVGGDVLAYHGVEAGTVGSELGVGTRITAGIDWHTDEKITQVDAVIARNVERIEKINACLDPLMQNKGALAALGQEQKDLLQLLAAELQSIRAELAAAQKDRETLANNTQRDRVNQVNVTSAAYPGVIVRFSHMQGQLKRLHRGAMSLVQDTAIDNIRMVKQFRLTREDDPAKPDVSKLNDYGKL